jgi:hypothetical protein
MTLYVKLNNTGEIAKYPYTLDMFRNENKNISFPRILNNRFLADRGVHPVYEGDKPFHNEITQTLAKKTIPIFEDGNWIIEWEIVEKNSETIENEKKHIETQLRNERSKLISETDWIILKSLEYGVKVPEKWENYRQALRDITNQENFPYTVNWPILP